jgi:hypothetical protein
MTRLTKWVTLRKQGLELVDPTEDGANLFQHYGDFNASIQGDAINAVNAILESLAVQADIVSGVPRQMLGVIEQRDAVENVKVGINQVSVLSWRCLEILTGVLTAAYKKPLTILNGLTGINLSKASITMDLLWCLYSFTD